MRPGLCDDDSVFKQHSYRSDSGSHPGAWADGVFKAGVQGNTSWSTIFVSRGSSLPS